MCKEDNSNSEVKCDEGKTIIFNQKKKKKKKK